MSSLSPKKKITIEAAAKYCNSFVKLDGTPIKVAIINPAKIPTPPRVGMTVCEPFFHLVRRTVFVFSNLNYNWDGKKVIRNASAALSKILSIQFTLQGN